MTDSETRLAERIESLEGQLAAMLAASHDHPRLQDVVRIGELEEECKRLKAECSRHCRERADDLKRDAGLIDVAQRECERLRIESNNASNACREHSEMLTGELHNAKSECERLRARADSLRADLTESKAECERLREGASAQLRVQQTMLDSYQVDLAKATAREAELVAALERADQATVDTVIDERLLLSEECERLRTSLSAEQGEVELKQACINGQSAAIDVLEAENERLRAALREVRDWFWNVAGQDKNEWVQKLDAELAGAPAEPPVTREQVE